jgi:hypothetical protein
VDKDLFFSCTVARAGVIFVSVKEKAEMISEINLSHECDEDAAECNCSEEQLAEDGVEIGKHAPGDSRCENRSAHTACSHDIERLRESMQSDVR